MKNFNILDYDCVIFDCDGVLLDINKQKIEAFKHSVEGYPLEIVSSFGEYCANSFGVSRYVKFKDFFRLFANEDFDENKYQLMLKNYSEICMLHYLKCEIIEDVEILLENLRLNNIKLFVASGSDQNELRKVFDIRNLKYYFEKIYGSPTPKEKIISEIINDNNFEKILFIGDAISDMNAAVSCNIDFIYMSMYTVQSTSQHDICINNSIKHIKRIDELFF